MCCVAIFGGEYVSFDRQDMTISSRSPRRASHLSATKQRVIAFEFNPKSQGSYPTRRFRHLKRVSVFHQLEAACDNWRKIAITLIGEGRPVRGSMSAIAVVLKNSHSRSRRNFIALGCTINDVLDFGGPFLPRLTVFSKREFFNSPLITSMSRMSRPQCALSQ